MYQGSPQQHRSLVSTITRSAGRPPKALRHLDWRGFLRAYFANVDAKDLADRDPQELAGAAFSHLEFAKRRRRAALVRVFNPTLREHGFVSPHTIIDVVNDDMPFLVDSINLALTERALTLHFLAHPIFAVSRDSTGTLRALHRRARGICGCQAAPRILSTPGSGPDRRSGGAEIPGRRDRAQHARRTRGVRRLGTHADRRPQRSCRPECAERALRPDRSERNLRPARVDGKSPFHLPWLP